MQEQRGAYTPLHPISHRLKRGNSAPGHWKMKLPFCALSIVPGGCAMHRTSSSYQHPSVYLHGVFFPHSFIHSPASLVAQMVKASACNPGDPGLIPGLGRSPGEANGNLLQYSCLENPMDAGAWWATTHRVAKSQAWFRD